MHVFVPHALCVARMLVQYLQQYCVHLAALPAARHPNPPRFLLTHAATKSIRVSSEKFGTEMTASAQEPLKDAVWRGVAVPYRPVRRQVDEPGLRGALVRAGRGRMVLHRVGTRALVRARTRNHMHIHGCSHAVSAICKPPLSGPPTLRWGVKKLRAAASGPTRVCKQG